MSVRSVLSRKQWQYRLRPSRFCRKDLLSIVASLLLLSLIMLLISACSSIFPQAAQSGTPVPGSSNQNITPAFDITPSPTLSGTPAGTPNITLQVIGSCPSALSSRWDSIVGTKTGVDKVQKVNCAPLESGGLAALVNVRYYAPGSRLDFYVYDNLNGTPVRRLAVQNLPYGDAEISPTNTIITSANMNNDPLGSNLFKEYAWNGSGYVQVLFPGIFPDMTHFQAEHDQTLVNQQLQQATATPSAHGSIWQNSAYSVVSRMAQNIFHWSSASIQNTTLVFNSRAGIYTVQTTNLGPGGGGFITSLFRLDNVVTNIFEVKSVTSINGTALLNSPPGSAQVVSPIHVSANYTSTGTILGRVAVYSDTYLTVGDTGAIHGSSSSGSVTFAPSVGFHLPSGGLQEGLVVFFATNQNNINLSNAAIVSKVFLA